jgi:nitroimidazol reductase NimA-like FMN-containing flavoprotein (pyridoxamine 5'-phosphate oxidase superfamily)
MLGELNDTQIDNLLVSQAIGRIGYTNGKQPFIIPVTYVYNGKNIIGQCQEGMKLEIMRKNPTICFQVDLILNMANWQSVLLQGTFRELKGTEADIARAKLFDRVLPLSTSSTIHAHEHKTNSKVDDSTRIKPVMYQVRIKKKYGRFEKQ